MGQWSGSQLFRAERCVSSSHSLSLLIILSICFFKSIDGNVISLKDGQPVTDWMESGFVNLKTNSWTTIKTTTTFSSPIVYLRSPPHISLSILSHRFHLLFFSTPLFLSGRSQYPHPLEARMKNLVVTNGVAQFQAKLIFPNDSYCSKQWWVPVDYPSAIQASWLVVEKGGYLLDGTTQLVAGTGAISGTVTKLDWSYTFGKTCHYPSQEGDDAYAPSAIFELQTSNNGNYFLNVRTTTWWYPSDASKCSYSWTTGRFFLEPHDGIPDQILFNYQTETLGYLLYDAKQQIVDCLDGVKVQFGMVDVISDVSVKLFIHDSMGVGEEGRVMGIYSSVLGYHGGDSISPTSYQDLSVSATDIYLYLQVLPLPPLAPSHARDGV
jgi:hypothetical protein